MSHASTTTKRGLVLVLFGTTWLFGQACGTQSGAAANTEPGTTPAEREAIRAAFGRLERNRANEAPAAESLGGYAWCTTLPGGCERRPEPPAISRR